MPHINGRLYTWKKLYRLQEQGIYYLELAEDAACKSMDPKRPYTHRQIHEQNIAIYSIVAARYPHWDRGAFRMRAPLEIACGAWLKAQAKFAPPQAHKEPMSLKALGDALPDVPPYMPSASKTSRAVADGGCARTTHHTSRATPYSTWSRPLHKSKAPDTAAIDVGTHMNGELQMDALVDALGQLPTGQVRAKSTFVNPMFRVPDASRRLLSLAAIDKATRKPEPTRDPRRRPQRPDDTPSAQALKRRNDEGPLRQSSLPSARYDPKSRNGRPVNKAAIQPCAAA